MVGSSTERRMARSGHAPQPVQLANWPLRDDCVRAWFMATSLVAISAIAGWMAGSLVMGLVVFAAFVIAAWRLWLPVRFEVTSKGVTQTVLGRRRRIPWTEFARYECRRKGVLLLTEGEASPLATLRGLFIRWHNQRDELLELLEFFIKSSHDSQPATTRTFQP